MRNYTIAIAILSVLLFGVVNTVYAWTINLAWDANTEEDLAGYKLYYTNTQGVYDMESPAEIILKPATTTSMVVGDGFHCWVLTAYDLAGNESGPSANEPCITLPDDAWMYDHTAPTTPKGFTPLEVLPYFECVAGTNPATEDINFGRVT